MTPFLFSYHKKLLGQLSVSIVPLFSIVSSTILSLLSSTVFACILLSPIALAQEDQLQLSKQLSQFEHHSIIGNSTKNLKTSSEQPSETLTPAACSVNGSTQTIWRLSNATRTTKQRCGSSRWRPAAELKYDCELAAMAKLHATDLSKRNVLSHTSANGDNMTARANKLNIAWLSLGENIANGHKTADAAHTAWLASPGHCKNIMNPEFNSIGVALENTTWVVVFAKKSN